MKKQLLGFLVFIGLTSSTFAMQIDIPDINIPQMDMTDDLEDVMDDNINAFEDNMDKTGFSTETAYVSQKGNKFLYSSPSMTCMYDDKEFSISEPTLNWKKNFLTGEILASDSMFTWKFSNGNSYYATPGLTLIKKGKDIQYSSPTTTVRLENGNLYYSTAVSTLKITKDGKIHYSSPTVTRVIDGKNWKYSAPTKSYSN
ncbi:hypothetical protein KGV52_01690 [Candidatus Gracilibacteria bacterium]|nr:hypothetical protein [Candidatus Gracilibacteria bacterium]